MTQDILLDNTHELLITNGDLVLGESDQQHIDLLLLTEKGEWKQSALTGIGIRRYAKTRFGLKERTELAKTINLQLEYDGYANKKAQINENGKITIDATR